MNMRWWPRQHALKAVQAADMFSRMLDQGKVLIGCLVCNIYEQVKASMLTWGEVQSRGWTPCPARGQETIHVSWGHHASISQAESNVLKLILWSQISPQVLVCQGSGVAVPGLYPLLFPPNGYHGQVQWLANCLVEPWFICQCCRDAKPLCLPVP